MYDGGKTRIRMMEGNSEYFLVEIRLHQGFVLIFFTLVINELTLFIQDEASLYMLFANT